MSPPDTAGTAPEVLRLTDVSIGYGPTSILSGVDLTIRAGEAVALLGENGSGKTTLVRGALGLARLQHGRLDWFGEPAERLDRARVGYVPQRHSVATAVPVTVREAVSVGRLPRSGLLGRLTPATRRATRTAVDAALDTVGLGSRAGTPLAHLSGGQQRRVLIARALASEPEVLVMDEPTAGVDAASQRSLARTFAQLRSAGVTLLVVTHELGALQGVLTRAVTLRSGQIVGDTTVDAVLSDAIDDPAHGSAAGTDHHHHHGDDDPSPTAGSWLPTPEVRR